jgi:hypothetical protein
MPPRTGFAPPFSNADESESKGTWHLSDDELAGIAWAILSKISAQRLR